MWRRHVYPAIIFSSFTVLIIVGNFSTGAPPSNPSPFEMQKSFSVSPLQDDANLNDVCFVGSKFGWAVGDRGVIWRTTDAGQTWQFCDSPVDCPLRSVCFLTNQIGWAAGGGTVPYTRVDYGVVLFTKDGGETWEQRISPNRTRLKNSSPQSIETTHLPTLHDIRFFDLEHGVAVGATSSDHPTGIFFTDDGGLHWQDVEGPRGNGWRAAHFLNAEIGVVAGLRGKVSLVGGSQLLQPRIDNFGLRGFRAIQLQNDETGWLVGDGGLVLQTSNGGVVWESPRTSLPKELRDIFDFRAVAYRGKNVWLAGTPGSVIWHSPDRGQSWTKQLTRNTQPINSLVFTSETDGWAVGALGLILHTKDGGQNWNAVRSKNRRVALMTIHARPDRVSFHLLAKQSWELGYRSAVVVVPRHDIGPNAHRAINADSVLQDAVVSAGGNTAELGWQLPIRLPGLERDREKLLEDWNRQTEGRLKDVFLGRLVALLRTWKPNVVIIDQPSEDDETGKIINSAVSEAVKQAADATQFIAQQELAGLEPWKVDRISVHVADGSVGKTHVDPYELLPRLGKTIEMAAATSYGRIAGKKMRPSGREAYRWLTNDIQLVSAVNTAGDFFTGIPLTAGSDARRKLPAYDDTNLERQIKNAQRQRNFRSYTERIAGDARQSAQLIAQLNSVTSGMTDAEGALQLAQLADKYRQHSRWDLVESTLLKLVQDYPDQPAAIEGMRWLFQLWCSSETAWQRSRSLGVRNQDIRGNPEATLSNLSNTQKLLSIDEKERDQSGLNFENDPLKKIEGSGILAIGKNENWRNGRVKNWHTQAVKMARLIRHQAPGLFTSPQVEFPLAALLRQKEIYNLSDEYYRSYLRAGEGDPWKRAAMREIWMARPVAAAPESLMACQSTQIRPILDGVLSDACWQDAAELKLRSGVESGEDVAGQRYPFAMLSYDSEHLYLAASVPRDPNLPKDRPVLEGRKHDADLSKFDRLSFYLDIDRDYATWYVFHIDQRGWTAEACWDDTRWNPKWYVAADADENRWRIEAAIPIRELAPQAPGFNTVWGLGIVRTMPAVDVQSWTRPASTTPRPETFGLLKFD